MIELRPFTEPDRITLAPWFPPAYSGAFVDKRFLDWANETPAGVGEMAYFVACRDAEPVSLVSLHWVRPERANVSIAVAPEARRTGVATATLEALRDAFPEVVEFAAYVDPENAASLALLESVGFARAESDAKDRELYVWRDGSASEDD